MTNTIAPALMTVTVHGVRPGRSRRLAPERRELKILSVSRRDSGGPARGPKQFVSRLLVYQENLMLKVIVAALLIACSAPARAGSALECLNTSAQNGGLAGCLGEAGGAAPAVAVQGTAHRSPLTVTTLKPEAEKGYRRVPTPTGYRDDEDGTASTGFFKGLDSGFKTVFAAVTYPAVAGIEACGAPNRQNIGTIAFFVLGTILSIPASIAGALIGAPIGAVAGMIAEKTSPGSTKDWFSF